MTSVYPFGVQYGVSFNEPLADPSEVPFALRVGDHDVVIEAGEVKDGKPGRLSFTGTIPTALFQQVMQTARRDAYRKKTGQPVAVDHQKESRRLKMILDALQEKPTMLATVLSVDPERAKCIVFNGGLSVEVAMLMKLEPGQQVRVSGETQQVMSVVESPLRAGNIVKVERVPRPGLCEIDALGGQTRTVSIFGPCEPGDRILLDSSNQVALENLGKPPNDHALTESTGVSWDDVGGLADAKRELREAIEGPIKNKELYEKFGRKGVRGVLLHGPPGNGKTMLGKAAATALAELHGDASKGAFIYVKGPELLNMFLGNTEANIRKIFDSAREHKARTGYPALVFLDEADAVLSARGQQQGPGAGMERTTVPQFLSEMDGLEDSGAIVVIATNRPSQLDPAVVRDGRIDRRIRVSRPTQVDAKAILERALAKTLLAKGSDASAMSELAVKRLWDRGLVLVTLPHGDKGKLVLRLSDVVSGAMIVGIVERAVAKAMRRAVDGGKEGVAAEDLVTAVESVHDEAKHVNHNEELVELLEASADAKGK